MTRLFYILTLCGFSLLLNTACKKEALLTYNAEDNIYFNYIANADPSTQYLGIYADTTNITFAFRPSATVDSIVRIPVAVTGPASDHDRTYGVSVDPSSTAVASTHYELPASFIIRAGRTQDSLALKFKRTADLKTKAVTLKLRLTPTADLKTQVEYKSKSPNSVTYISSTDTIRTLTFKLNISDMLAEGPYWASDYSYYFGTFSEKKVRLMNQIIGMPLDFWSTAPKTPEQKSDMTYYGGFMFRYLSDQAFAGNRIFEADGITPMTMGYYFR